MVLGMAGFYARFVPGYGDTAAAIYNLKNGVSFVWDESPHRVIEGLKRALCEAPGLQAPDFSKDFVLATDASDLEVSTVLQQVVNGELASIAYYSRVLTAAEKI
jgi:hypothetical protein